VSEIGDKSPADLEVDTSWRRWQAGGAARLKRNRSERAIP
jgi:hypothetical protein